MGVHRRLARLTAATELAPAGRTGEYMGGFAGTFSIALIVGPRLGVALLDRFGASLTWAAMFVCGLAAAALDVQGRVDKALPR